MDESVRTSPSHTRRSFWPRWMRLSNRDPYAAVIRPAITLCAVTKLDGGRPLLINADATFMPGELTVVRVRHSGDRTRMARLLSGQVSPDAGEILRDGLSAAPLGSAQGFIRAAPVVQSLDMIAAAYGVATRPLIKAVAGLMDDPAALQEPFDTLRGRDKMLVTFATPLLMPASLYPIDSRPLPTDAKARRRLTPLWRGVRARAATVWLSGPDVDTTDEAPDREATLEDGQLLFTPPENGGVRQNTDETKYSGTLTSNDDDQDWRA